MFTEDKILPQYTDIINITNIATYSIKPISNNLHTDKKLRWTFSCQVYRKLKTSAKILMHPHVDLCHPGAFLLPLFYSYPRDQEAHSYFHTFPWSSWSSMAAYFLFCSQCPRNTTLLTWCPPRTSSLMVLSGSQEANQGASNQMAWHPGGLHIQCLVP